MVLEEEVHLKGHTSTPAAYFCISGEAKVSYLINAILMETDCESILCCKQHPSTRKGSSEVKVPTNAVNIIISERNSLASVNKKHEI
jgi:hypothetical protein